MYVITMDTWNKGCKATNAIIDEEGNIAKVIQKGVWPHAFGTYIIKKGMIMSWKFKLDGDRMRNLSMRPMAILIGIVENDSKLSKELSGAFYDKIHGGWAFYTYLNDIKHNGWNPSKKYGEKCYPGGVVKMILDMTQKDNKNGLLSFEINDKVFGIAVDDIDIDKEYCLAIQMSGVTPQSIQIIE